MTTTNTAITPAANTLNVKSARRAAYEAKVAAFMSANGPAFTLVTVTQGLQKSCDCCGYNPLRYNFLVRSTSTNKEFVIGSECQELVLGISEAKLPAASIRALAEAELLALWTKWGDININPANMSRDELVRHVINARRRWANRKGWDSRRVQGKAPAKPAPATTP